MAIVSVESVTKQFGTQIVLDSVSFEVHPREVVGLVGANGAGKTTLFRLITGELDPDLGTVKCSKNVAIGHLRQEPDVKLERDLYSEVAEALANLVDMENRLHELSHKLAESSDDAETANLMAAYDRLHARFVADGGHTFQTRMGEILGGLGFLTSEYHKPMSVLSGGQRCRAALAKLLLMDRELLLLDEPTNHLDIDAVRWLEKFLAAHKTGAVIISHDRYLLDRVCDRIVEIERGKTASFPGNYSNYIATKEVRRLTEQRQFEKDQEFIKKEQAFIKKHIAGQRTAEAKGRRKRLERRMAGGEFAMERQRVQRSATIRFDQASEYVGTVLRVEDLSMAFTDKPLFANVTFTVQAGERLAVTGPNGTGKTTLLRIITDELEPSAGKTLLEPGLRIGYHEQDGVTLDPDCSIVALLRAARSDWSEHQARSYAARFRFTGDDVFKQIGSLSGGEQSRLRLAMLILEQPDLLILDEPTNHLDIPSREVLEEALLEFGGTVLVVSHDRYFLDRIADRLLVLRRDGYVLHPGNYTDYIVQLESKPARKGSNAKTTGSAKAQRVADKPKATASPFDHLSVDKLEQMVIDLESRLATVQDRFGEAEVYKDPEVLATLQEEAEEIENELSAVDAAWQERVDAGQT